MKLKTKRSKNITEEPIVAFGHLYFLLPLLSHFKVGRNGMVNLLVYGKHWFDMLFKAYVEPRYKN